MSGAERSEVVVKREPIPGLKGVVERTTVRGGLRFDSNKKLLGALIDFTTGEFRVDTTGHLKFVPGVLSAGDAWIDTVYQDQITTFIADAVKSIQADDMYGTVFEREYASSRPNFPKRSHISVDRISEGKYHDQYILQIINSDNDSAEKASEARAVEEGFHQVRRNYSERPVLEERLTLPFALDEEGRFDVDVRKVVNTVMHVIEDTPMDGMFHQPEDWLNGNYWSDQVRARQIVRRWAKDGKKEQHVGKTLRIKTPSSLVVEVGLQGVDPTTDNLQSKWGTLSGVADSERGDQPGLAISIYGNDGLPVVNDEYLMDRFIRNLQDAFKVE